MSEPIIELEDVYYVYPDGTRAINGISLRVDEGEIVAVVGPNGAGKSTLLMVMSGLLRPSKGRALLFGGELNGSRLREVRRRVGIVFQDPDDQLFCSTVLDDICFGPLQLNLSREEIWRRIEEVSGILDIKDLLGKAPFRLSEGQKKKVALATTLVMKPDVLFVDEPVTNIDSKSAMEITGFLRSLHKQMGKTIVIATSDLNTAFEMSSRVYVIKEGRLVGSGQTVDVLLNSDLLRKADLQIPKLTSAFLKLQRRLGLSYEEAVKLVVDILRSPGD